MGLSLLRPVGHLADVTGFETDSNGPVCTPAETLNCGALSPSPRSSRQGAGGAVMSIPTWVRSSFVSDMLD